MKNKAKVFIGTSGWQYDHWGNGVFYPSALPKSKWFEFYSSHFNTVEINSSFYHLPKKETFEKWRKNSPENFQFVIKASRFITHIKKLKEPEKSVGEFLKRASVLRTKLAVILFQLPPGWNLNLERLKNFIDYINSQQTISKPRIAIELRNKTWANDSVYRLLSENNFALCFADWPDLTIEEPVTADFVYLRRHGPSNLYASSYDEDFLSDEARNIREFLKQGHDVYVYFNNDAFGWAIENALMLKKLLE